MPTEEIAAMLTADDPDVIRRHLELHRERLEERLAAQRRTIGILERTLFWGSGDARPPGRLDVCAEVVPIGSHRRGVR